MRKSGATFADVDFEFSYDHLDEFVLPPWPYFPSGASPYDYNNVQFANFKDGVNKVVGSQWARVITRLDMTAMGALQMVGSPIWGNMVLGAKSDTMKTVNGDYNFGRLNSLTAAYPERMETELRNSPILLGGNITHIKYGIILVPTLMIKMLSPEIARECYGSKLVQGVKLHVNDVSIPFPFYTSGVKWEDYQTFDRTTVELNISCSEDYAIALVMITDTKRGDTFIQVPEKADSLLMNGNPTMYRGTSPYGQMARILEKAANSGLIGFATLTNSQGDVVTRETTENRNLLIDVFKHGADLPTNGNKFSAVETDEIPVPAGLNELPYLPSPDYSYICDFQGVVYVASLDGQKVRMPYQVFDLIALVKVYTSAMDECGKLGAEPNEATVEYGRQIELIKNLFAHQANVMKGTAYAYEAMMYGGME